MKTIISRKHWRAYVLVLGALILVANSLMIPTPKAQAGIIVGNPGPGGSSGGGGSGYWTSNGHGWALYNVGGSGPSAFQDGNSWSSVSNTCAAAGSNKVWAYVIRNGAGNEKVYTFTNTYEYYEGNFNPNNNNRGAQYYPSKSWWIDRPGAGGDPYEYNSNGQHDGQQRMGGQNGYGAADNVVRHVRGLYEDEGGDRNIWGWQVGWFCWSDNPPWTIAVTATANTTVAEPEDTITWTHTARNSGPNTTNRAVNWQYNDKRDLGTGTGGNWTMNSGTTSGTTRTNTSTYTVTQADFGKRLCRTTSATPDANVNNNTVESAESCVIIAKKPKVQVLGGSLSTGRAFIDGTPNTNAMIVTSQSITQTAPIKTYGSWGEYGLLASGIIEGAGSGAALKDGREGVGTACDYSKLSFSNATTATTCNATAIGSYRSSTRIPDISGAFEVTSTTPVFSNIDDAQFKRVEQATSNITITGGTLDKGEWLVINAKGHRVTITGNITYTADRLAGINEIPQLVIIADSIDIAGGVGQIDAWLIANGANGSINTCSDVAAGGNLSAQVCNNTLTVNGPVMAKHLYLQRTARADTPNNIGDPAETFNLRADAYLWGMSRSLQGVHINVADAKELPPRF